MLPKPLRLRKKKDFAALATRGHSVFGPYATLRVRELSGAVPSKVAFITSVKTFKQAVDRNRAKRRLREAVRQLLPEIPSSRHLLFIAKPESKDVAFSALVSELRRLILKIPQALREPVRPSSRGRKIQKKTC